MEDTLKNTEGNNNLKIQRRIEENDSENFVSTKNLLESTQSELKDSLEKFIKTHDIYKEYYLSLTQEKKKLEDVNLENDT